MSSKILMGAAAIALLAGVSVANAQTKMDETQKGAAPGATRNQADPSGVTNAQKNQTSKRDDGGGTSGAVGASGGPGSSGTSGTVGTSGGTSSGGAAGAPGSDSR